MAIRYAVANGNFSANATWDGGASIPASGDYVYANGYAVVLDADVNIGSGTLSTEVCPTTGIGGGSFSYGSSRVVVGNVKAGSSSCVIGTASNLTLTLTGDITGGSGINAYGVVLASSTNYTTAILNLTGNITGGSGLDAHGVYQNASIGSTARHCVISMTGNIYASSTANGINAKGAATAMLTTLAITGDIISDTRAGVNSCGNLVLIGSATASGAAHAVTATLSTSWAKVVGTLNNNGGMMALADYRIMYFEATAPSAWKFYTSDETEQMLYTGDTLENPPAESDVRVGVVYGIDDAYTGTLEVGGATPAEFVAALEASDLGQRMAKCAITEEVLTMLGNLE